MKIKVISTTLLVVTFILVHSFALSATNTWKESVYHIARNVEISPGNFLQFVEHSKLWRLKHGSFAAVHTLETKAREFWQIDTTYLSIPWGDKKLYWVGVGIPVSLRSFGGELYLIVFDRDYDFDKRRYRFYKEDHNNFREIYPAEFPKSIATHNLWFQDDEEKIAARDLNPESEKFLYSHTADIWYQLEFGKEHYEEKKITAAFLQDYKEKYKVVRLPTLNKPANVELSDLVDEHIIEAVENIIDGSRATYDKVRKALE